MSVVVELPAVVEAIVNNGTFWAVDAEFEMERKEYGDVVPIPRFPPLMYDAPFVEITFVSTVEELYMFMKASDPPITALILPALAARKYPE